jgi:hypothetical protein
VIDKTTSEYVPMSQFIVLKLQSARLLTTRDIMATNEAYGWSRYLVNLDTQIAVSACNEFIKVKTS